MIRKLIFVLAFLAVAATGGRLAFADANDHAVLEDKRGAPVYNSTGNCVRTMWNNAGDPCAPEMPAPPPPKAVVVMPPPPPLPPAPPQKHTVISDTARTVYFPFNKAVLTEEAKAQLDTLAKTLKAAMDIQEAHVLGAADRIGSNKYNDKLSQKRAEAVRDYLIARGYANASVTHTKWVGKSQPITNCAKKLKGKKLIACLQNDRRVQIDIVYKTEVMGAAPAAPSQPAPPATTIITAPPSGSPAAAMPVMPVR